VVCRVLVGVVGAEGLRSTPARTRQRAHGNATSCADAPGSGRPMTCQAGSSRGVCLGRGGRLALECEEAALEELEDLVDDLHRALVVGLVGLGLESIACPSRTPRSSMPRSGEGGHPRGRHRGRRRSMPRARAPSSARWARILMRSSGWAATTFLRRSACSSAAGNEAMNSRSASTVVAPAGRLSSSSLARSMNAGSSQKRMSSLLSK
jgi:hypothetical protein